MTEEDIVKKCKQYKIEKYTINPDMTIDVNGDVYLVNRLYKKLPIKFHKVTGSFNCNVGELTTLDGCPKYVDGRFLCSHNHITTLLPLTVNFYIGGAFDCYANNITEVKEYGRLFFGTIVGRIYTGNFDLNNFLNDNKNPPKKDLPRLLSELRKIQL